MARTVNYSPKNAGTELTQVDATQTIKPLTTTSKGCATTPSGRGERQNSAARQGSARSRRSLARNQRGAVAAEYALLLTFVAVPTVLGILAGAATMLSNYNSARAAMLAPNP